MGRVSPLNRFILLSKVCQKIRFLRFLTHSLDIVYRRRPIAVGQWVHMWPSSDRFAIISSREAECWDPKKAHGACEWWYFDALSDDGSEAVSIVFLDNFTYSPDVGAMRNDRTPLSLSDLRPAVSFTYFSGGKAVYQAKEEVPGREFFASETEPRCRIGQSGFRYESAPYGSGYLVSVDLVLPDGEQLRANLEWLAIDSDLDPTLREMKKGGHWWNIAAPRCDVSGRITVENKQGQTQTVRSFRGTGYHDHSRDDRWLFRAVTEWNWGRAHFAGLTAVFFDVSQIGLDSARSHLILIRDGRVQLLQAENSNGASNGNANRYFSDSEDADLEVKSLKLIESNFYHQRFLSEVRLKLNGHEHAASGITEAIKPRDLRYRWLNWLNELRARS